MMKHYQITVKGKVQGVYFRASTKAVADHLGIKGLVYNQPDGSVYVEAEGDDFALEAFMDFLREGPEQARVENLQCQEAEIKNYRNFEVVKKISN
jgi:acylphosphatase